MTDDFSDEQLTAYLDGETDSDLSHRIEMAVAGSPGVAARLDALAMDTDALKDAFDDLLTLAPDAPALPQPRPRVWPRWAAAAMGAAACVAIGFWSGQQSDAPIDDWRDFAAAYHRLYVPQTLAASDFTDAQKAAQLQIAGAAINLPLSPETLQNADMTLKRTQVLGYDGAAIAHLAFVTATGVPVAFCITEGGPEAAQMATLHGMPSVYWYDGAHGFLLLGDLPDAMLKKIAASLGGPAA